MSNVVVGTIYQQIIEKVIQASQNDFEEFGVDQATLTEMRDVWQTKLTNLNIAQFPWSPAAVVQDRNTPTVPSNAPKQEPLDSPQIPSMPTQPVQTGYGGTRIKTESGYDSPVSATFQQQPNGFAGSGGYPNPQLTAQQRRDQLIEQRFGVQGSNLAMGQHGQHGVNMPQPGQQQHQQQQHRMQMAGQQMPGQGQQGQRPPHIAQRQSGLYSAQNDGSGDALEEWSTMYAGLKAEPEDGPNGRHAADRLMRDQVEAMAQRQDSGLMVPLDELPKSRKRKVARRVRKQASSSEASSSKTPRIAQLDGEDDDEDKKEERDEDAINSDLDDPEDDNDGGDDSNDENMDYMLCTYDKVQRVKNKWKCTLKDGILTTNKKEYLFHKANGEFEW
ncbi:transcription factor IIA, alpha/beta subunit [Mytilinidion resinicola]|uniref:Transcription factor IIA, alpha/beta subunit n=1 Tax=Mytilinidion resinicola TaxID=574789 RepID=A0A6A6YHZ4_9PEZI|nr:transcription factor IIA, alpha/beta subunit [Mytilinidion resinicola]KAF2808199.1 transcription factor IIA, alpha/beta subunit [Mytilinidion resinicola]